MEKRGKGGRKTKLFSSIAKTAKLLFNQCCCTSGFETPMYILYSTGACFDIGNGLCVSRKKH